MRVFISSTFRDMKAERDHLVKFVFPELRAVCESRGVTWGEVDLRWGITDEQKAEGKVLPVCLAEIAACRPYFIGLLGERYGWVPQHIEPDLIAAEPWLAQQQKRSVTELEILHGVLNDSSMGAHAFFYFRDPSYARGAAGMQEGADPSEIARLGQATAEREVESRRQKLSALKQRIREAAKTGNLAHAPRENYASPEALGKLVAADLRAVIDQLFPVGRSQDQLERETAEHEAFSRSRARVYIQRGRDFETLDAHVATSALPIVVLGESGSGKSALLANWVRRLRERSHADEPGPLIIEHYAGASAASTDWAAMLRRFLSEFDRRFKLKLEAPPTEPLALRVAFANALNRVAARGQLVLVIDGLNQLEDRDRAPDLGWLPRELPKNVHLVLSTLPGRSLDELKRRGWPTLAVAPLSEQERTRLVREYLHQYRKALSQERVQQIVEAEPSSNPLYLRALLEELRLWGEHETLGRRIEYYLEAKDPPALYSRIFARWEHDYQDRNGLVGDLLSLVSSARRGLSSAELRDLLARDEEPLPQAVLSPVLLAAGDMLINRSGLLGPGHHYVRIAVRNSYLATDAARRSYHERLASYFESGPRGPRRIDELPWQLAQAESWRKLCQLLSDLAFLTAAWEADAYDVKAYWAQIEGHTELHVDDAYANVVQGAQSLFLPELTSHIPEQKCVARLLAYTGHLKQAMTIWRRLDMIAEDLDDQAELSICLGERAALAYKLGMRGMAKTLLEQRKDICDRLVDREGLQATVGSLAEILMDEGQTPAAEDYLEQQKTICESQGDLGGLRANLASRARLLWLNGRRAEVWPLLEQEERICRQLGHLDGLQENLGRQGLSRAIGGEPKKALELYRERERICRQLGNLDGLQASLGRQAWTLGQAGRLQEGLGLLGERERYCRQLMNPTSLADCVGQKGVLLNELGRFDEALPCLEEEERLCRQIRAQRSLQFNLAQQAAAHKALGRFDKALALLEEGADICRETCDSWSLAVSLHDQALVQLARGDAQDCAKRADQARRILRGPHWSGPKYERLKRELEEIMERAQTG